MGLCIHVKLGEKINIGETVLQVYEIRGTRIKLHFEGPKDIKIERQRKESNDKRRDR